MTINPFYPDGIVKHILFGGRSEYTIKLLKKIARVKNGLSSSFYIYGERGIGKTALAKFIRYICEDNSDEFYNLNFLTSYYSVQKGQTIQSTLEASLNILGEKIPTTTLEQIGNNLGGLFKGGKFKIGALGINAQFESNKSDINTEKQVYIKDQFVSIIKKLIKKIKSEITDNDNKRDGILIIIDEMDNLADIDSAASIIRGITTTLDFEDLGHVSFLFIGYKDGYERFVKSDTSIKRQLETIQLLEMPNDEILETFEKGFKEAKLKWSKEDLKKNAYLSGGYPLAIQVLGYNLVDCDKDNLINNEDWEKSISLSATELISKEYSSYFSFEKKNKNNKEKILSVLAIAKRINGGKLTLNEIHKITNIKNPRQYMKEFITKGIILIDDTKKKFMLKNDLLHIAIQLDYLNIYGSEDGIKEVNKIEEIIKKIKKTLI